MSDALTPELQQAIAAARAGDVEKAKTLADQVIQDDPENESALYLMSALAPSSEEREAYLSQILLVNPEHSGAQKYLTELDEPAILAADDVVVSAEDLIDDDEFLDDEFARLDETVVMGTAAALSADEILELSQDQDFTGEDASDSVPDWLQEEQEFTGQETIVAADNQDLVQSEELPDWLSEDGPSTVTETYSQPEELADELPEMDLEPLPPEPDPKSKPTGQRGPSDKTLTIVLVVLVIVALAIVTGIVYVALTQPFLS